MAFLFLNFEVPWERLAEDSKIDVTDGKGFEEATLCIVSGVVKLELATVEVQETPECVDKQEEVKKELSNCLDEELEPQAEGLVVGSKCIILAVVSKEVVLVVDDKEATNSVVIEGGLAEAGKESSDVECEGLVLPGICLSFFAFGGPLSAISTVELVIDNAKQDDGEVEGVERVHAVGQGEQLTLCLYSEHLEHNIGLD